MVEVVEDLVKGHSTEIINTVNELYDSSSERKAGLDIPVVLRVKRDLDTGFTFSGKIDIRKVERIKDERSPINYNPDIPDPPGYEDGKVPDSSKDKSSDKNSDNKSDNSADNVGATESDTKAENPPAETPEKTGDNKNFFVWPDGKKAEIVNYDDVTNELTEEVCKKDLVRKQTEQGLSPFKENELVEFKGLPEGAFRVIRGINKSGNEIRYFLQKLHTAPEAEAPLCGVEHKDGRKCKRPAGHTGKHSFGTKPENTGIEPEKGADSESNGEEDPYKEVEGETAPAPTPAPTPKKAEKEESIALFLAKHELALADVEKYLRNNGKLGMKLPLLGTRTAEEYVRKNIETIKKEIKA